MQRLDAASNDFLLDVLGLKEEQVRRRAGAAHAFSIYRWTTQADLAAATLAVITASCWTLIDTIASRGRWAIAAERYMLLTHPYAEVLSVCAGNMRAIRVYASPQSPLALQCRIMQLGWLSIVDPQNLLSYREELYELQELVDRMGALTPGQLAIPVRNTYELARALTDEWSGDGT